MQPADLQKGCQEYTIRKDYFVQQTLLRKLHIHMQNNEIGPLFSTLHKINLKQVTNVYVRPETVKLLEENFREKLHDLGLGSDIMDTTSKALATKNKYMSKATLN